jgi:hypothetical protein
LWRHGICLRGEDMPKWYAVEAGTLLDSTKGQGEIDDQLLQ